MRDIRQVFWIDWLSFLNGYEIIDKEGEGGLLRQYLCKTQEQCLYSYPTFVSVYVFWYSYFFGKKHMMERFTPLPRKNILKISRRDLSWLGYTYSYAIHQPNPAARPSVHNPLPTAPSYPHRISAATPRSPSWPCRGTHLPHRAHYTQTSPRTARSVYRGTGRGWRRWRCQMGSIWARGTQRWAFCGLCPR